MTTTRFFELLSHDVAEAKIAPQLKLSDLLHVVQTSKIGQNLFQKPLSLAKTEAFADDVEFARYERIEKALSYDPKLMFQATMMTIPGREPALMSPFCYALNVMDPFLWQIFEQYLTALDIKQLRALVAECEHITPIQLQLFFAEYDKYLADYSSWYHCTITDDEFFQSWINVGQAQKKYLPHGWLKLFCDTKTDWSETSTFIADIKARPGPCKIWIGDANTPQELNLDELGTLFALFRRKEQPPYRDAISAVRLQGFRMGRIPDVARNNLAVFKHLLSVRQDQLQRVKSHLLQLTLSCSRRKGAYKMLDRNEKAEKVKKYFFTYKVCTNKYCISDPAELENIRESVQYLSKFNHIPKDEIKIIELHMPEKDFYKELPTKRSYLSKKSAEIMLSKNEEYKRVDKNAQTLVFPVTRQRFNMQTFRPPKNEVEIYIAENYYENKYQLSRSIKCKGDALDLQDAFRTIQQQMIEQQAKVSKKCVVKFEGKVNDMPVDLEFSDAEQFLIYLTKNKLISDYAATNLFAVHYPENPLNLKKSWRY